MPLKIVGLGEVLWDVLPSGKKLGGAPANFAYHANALGAESRIISRVGHDQEGGEILLCLNQLGLGIDLIQIDPDAPTGTVSVELAADGQPQYVIHENVAWDRIAAKKEAREAVAEANAVCFGTLAQRSEKSRGAIHKLLSVGDALKILDVNLRQKFYSAEIIEQSLRAANVLKINDAELPVLAELLCLGGDFREQTAELARRYELRLVVYTRGSKGSLLYSGGNWSEHPGIKTEVADTIGAGDSFTAAMTIGYLSGWDLDKINEQANRVAAFVASQPGGTPMLPADLRAAFGEAVATRDRTRRID